jgi:hypothetical protein
MSPISADNTTSIAFSEAPISPEKEDAEKITAARSNFELKPELKTEEIDTITNQFQDTPITPDNPQGDKTLSLKEEITSLGDNEPYKEQEQNFAHEVQSATANESKP